MWVIAFHREAKLKLKGSGKMAYTALYRKFRPLTFGEIVGQEHITKTLKNQLIAGRVGHAYLFNGCRGTGKTSAAKILARAVNCLNPKDGEPCNECEICKAALSGALTDIVEMDAASNNSVEDIRLIRDEVNFLPTLAKYRVYIIELIPVCVYIIATAEIYICHRQSASKLIKKIPKQAFWRAPARI